MFAPPRVVLVSLVMLCKLPFLVRFLQWDKYFFVFLFKNGMWKTTFLLWLIFPLYVFYYYGIILLTTTIFKYDKHCSKCVGGWVGV